MKLMPTTPTPQTDIKITAMKKIQLEKIPFEPHKSFKLFYPILKNYFYWHYHPEIELVFVKAPTGIRHVGQHISSYETSDLILIGPNIPHLNFDYGLQTEYEHIVVQLRADFLGDSFQHTPELFAIGSLFEKAAFGLSFRGHTKERAAELLRSIDGLDVFHQLQTLLEIFQLLATSREVLVLNDKDTSIDFLLKDKVRMGSIYEYIHAHFDEKPDVNHVASMVHLTTAAFCRYFKKQTNMTFTEFVNHYRINQAKSYLLHDKNVTETCFIVGFESVSYFNRTFKKVAGLAPSEFKKRYHAPSSKALFKNPIYHAA
jgi:AraC-like DNA-binding protein